MGFYDQFGRLTTAKSSSKTISQVQKLNCARGEKMGRPRQIYTATTNSLLDMARPRLGLGNARNHVPAI